jgi:hypothetical protein
LVRLSTEPKEPETGMKIKSTGDRAITIEFTRNEIGIINNALNEVCNGIDLEGEFETRMGCNKDDALRLLEVIHGLI